MIDGAGGSLYTAFPRLMREGGIIANYGQTADIKGVGFNMSFVLKNIEIKGSTMGSRTEFVKMVKFVEEKNIKPIVSHVWQGLNQDSIDQAYSTMMYVLHHVYVNVFYLTHEYLYSNGDQFGKLVIEINDNLHSSPKL